MLGLAWRSYQFKEDLPRYQCVRKALNESPSGCCGPKWLNSTRLTAPTVNCGQTRHSFRPPSLRSAVQRPLSASQHAAHMTAR